MGLFDLNNPKGLLKVMMAAGIKIHFDPERQMMIIETEHIRQEHSFVAIERLVNGNE